MPIVDQSDHPIAKSLIGIVENPRYRFYYSTSASLCCPESIAAVAAARTRFAQEHQDMVTLQKQCGGDRDSARFFKEEARDRLKHYRAACFILPWLTSDYPGDCEFVEESKFPIDLADELDHVANVASIA